MAVKRREDRVPALTAAMEDYLGRPYTARNGSGTGCVGSFPVMAEDCENPAGQAPNGTGEGTPAAAALKIQVHAVLADRRLATAFQPIYDLTSGQVVGVEALARFRSELGPDFWFAQAEAAGMVVDMELAAIEAAMSAAVLLPQHLYVSVNASPATCVDPAFLGLLLQAPVPLTRIVLELTEHQPVKDYARLLKTLAPLRSSGMRVAVDDAGAGHSSMLHVLRLAPNIIKLDKELIRDIDSHHLRKAFARAMVHFAADIGTTITAEGIETAAELDFVTGLGIATGQGYFLGHPTMLPDQWAQWDSQDMEELQHHVPVGLLSAMAPGK